MSWSSVSRANDAERGSTRLWLTVRLIGAGLLLATGAIHLDLYLTGYRTIPTIGGLFLLQVIAAFGLGAAMIMWSSRLAAAAGAGFAIATLGGYVLSLRRKLVRVSGGPHYRGDRCRGDRSRDGYSAGRVRPSSVLRERICEKSDSWPTGRCSSAPHSGRQVGSQRIHVADVGSAWPFARSSGASLYGQPILEASARGEADPRCLSAHQSTGLYALPVRARYIEHVDLLRDLCDLLAACDRHASRRTRRDWQARNDQTNRRNDPSHLRRPSALHLYRRLCSWPVHWQQHQLERWVLVRDTCIWLTGNSFGGCCSRGEVAAPDLEEFLN